MPRPRSKPTILVVEDEAPLMTLLRYNLEKQGFNVDEAADGQEALLRVSEARPDLVLLDWMLPALSGIEVCRQLRRRPNTRDLPIIMVTARTEDQDAVRALDTGADDYIAKPFVMDALLARIRALLRRSGGAATKGTLTYRDLTMDQDSHRVSPRRAGAASGPDRIPAAGVLPAASRAGVHPRTDARRGVGARHPCRAAHRGRAYPPAAQGDQRRARGGPDPHGALGRAMRWTPRIIEANASFPWSAARRRAESAVQLFRPARRRNLKVAWAAKTFVSPRHRMTATPCGRLVPSDQTPKIVEISLALGINS